MTLGNNSNLANGGNQATATLDSEKKGSRIVLFLAALPIISLTILVLGI